MGTEKEGLEVPTMKRRTAVILISTLSVVSVIILITGIVLFAKARRPAPLKSTDDICGYSEEAKRISLDKFFQKVQQTYYELHPQLIYLKPRITTAEIRKLYKAYDPTPRKIKERTDKAQELLKEINDLKTHSTKLKQREKKAISQVKFFLKFVFSTPYDGNYYAGDWMLGPDLFCYKPICSLPYEIENNLQYFNPSNVEGFELFRDKLVELNATVMRYIENLRIGVETGMVGSVETCEAGLQALTEVFPKVHQNGGNGILQEEFVQIFLDSSFFSGMQNQIQELLLWRKKYNGQSVEDSMREFVLKYLGKPINKLLRFLQTEYKSHCVPSEVSSGLATLPLPYVYTNGKPDTSKPTTRTLPTGEPLNGSRAYELIMPYFTTNRMTPDEVYKIGVDSLNKLYPEALEIARQVTGSNNNDTAKDAFITRLNESDMFFSDVIPQNESDKQAHERCRSRDGAKKYCPIRWQAMQKWFKEARQVMSMMDEKTVDMFHFTGQKRTTPNCPVRLELDFIPVSGAQSYARSDGRCETPATYYIPFFLDRPGPRYEEWSINAHEARPGHHTQDQGFVENFQDPCGGLVTWVQDVTKDSYNAFTEGWGLYAENPLIARETDVYKDEPFQKYGMLKWQIWRALRLIVDTGLHHRGMTQSEALQKFADYTWTTGDTTEKELTRYQSNPGQATAYMIGQRQLLKLREYAQKELGSKFNLKDFHYQVLSQGTAPLSYLDDHIKAFVKCVKKTSEKDCNYVVKSEILKPPVKTGKGRTADDKGTRRDFVDLRKQTKPIRRRYL